MPFRLFVMSRLAPGDLSGLQGLSSVCLRLSALPSQFRLLLIFVFSFIYSTLTPPPSSLPPSFKMTEPFPAFPRVLLAKATGGTYLGHR